MGAIVAVAGVAAALFLLAERRPAAAGAALVLSVAFSLLIAILVPRTSVTLYDGTRPVLAITQSSPVAAFVVTDAAGTPLARLRRSPLSRFGRNRWLIEGTVHGYAVEESLGRALMRKLLGKFNRARQSNIRIFAGHAVGVIVRRPDASGESDYLDVSANGTLDRRIAVALATLVFGLEP